MPRISLRLRKKRTVVEQSNREAQDLSICEKTDNGAPDNTATCNTPVDQSVSPGLFTRVDVPPSLQERRRVYSSSEHESPNGRAVQQKKRNEAINERQVALEDTEETGKAEESAKFPGTTARSRLPLPKRTYRTGFRESTANFDTTEKRHRVEHAKETDQERESLSSITTAHTRLPAPRRMSRRDSVQSASYIESSNVPSTSTRELEKYAPPDLVNKIEKSAILDGTFFEVCAQIEDAERIPVHCKLCNDGKQLLGSLTISTNLVKHLKRFHIDEHSKYLEYKKTKRMSRKRSAEPMRSEDEPRVKRHRKTLNTKALKSRIAQFIIETISPLSIVDQPSFRDLFSDFDVTMISRRTLTRDIIKLNEERFKLTKQLLSKTNYVCTTSDIWSGRRRSFFGVTCHFIDENFKRQSLPLACRRFTGSHTYDKIAEMLSDIHNGYGLDHQKIVASITDNAKNFVKAFEEFGIELNSPMLTKPCNTSREFENTFSDSDESNSDTDISSSPEIEDVESSHLLPAHLRCAAHTLNLVATTDLIKTLKSNQQLYTRHSKTIDKCSQLWHKAALPKSSEIIKATVGHTFSYPVVTRWNSLYDSLTQIIKEKDKLQLLFQRLDLKDPFTKSELLYIEEYCDVMKPLVQALDILQGENKVYYGILLPTLITLKGKLEKLQLSNFRFGRVLVTSCLNSLNERFANMLYLDDRASDAIVATISHPEFKLQWFHKAKKCYNLDLNVGEVKAMFIEKAKSFRDKSEFGADENISGSIASFLQIESVTSQQIHTDSEDCDGERESIEAQVQILSYMQDKRTILEMLKDYPIVQELFYKYNTPLTSSAPVERLFSFASITNAPRRHALSDKNFERIVLLKSFSKSGHMLET